MNHGRLSNSPNKAVIERNWRWRASPSLSLTDTWLGPWGRLWGRGSVFTAVCPSLCTTPAGSPSLTAPRKTRKAKQPRPTALVVDVYSAGTLPPVHGNADNILRRLGEKYFPKQADSRQNKHLGWGVHTPSKESHLSLGKYLWVVKRGRWRS